MKLTNQPQRKTREAQLREIGGMVIYEPAKHPVPWWCSPFDDDRIDSPSKCSWIVVWPDWML